MKKFSEILNEAKVKFWIIIEVSGEAFDDDNTSGSGESVGVYFYIPFGDNKKKANDTVKKMNKNAKLEMYIDEFGEDEMRKFMDSDYFQVGSRITVSNRKPQKSPLFMGFKSLDDFIKTIGMKNFKL